MGAPKGNKSYLKFVEIADTGKTKLFSVENDFERIAMVKWHGAWRKYVLFTQQDVIFDTGCLEEITKFISQQMESRKI